MIKKKEAEIKFVEEGYYIQRYFGTKKMGHYLIKGVELVNISSSTFDYLFFKYKDKLEDCSSYGAYTRHTYKLKKWQN